MAVLNAKADSNGNADTFSSNSSGITAVNRLSGDRTWLVLRQSNADLLTIPNTPQGIIPKLQGAYMQSNQLAVVVDYDLCFLYQLYALQSGSWVLQKQVDFSAMGESRRARLVLVQMTDLTHVTLTYNTGGADLGRRKGIVHSGDPQDIFEFDTSGTLKNGAAYNYNYGRE